MKKRRRKRRQPRGQNQPLYIQTKFTVYNRLMWNDDDPDIDLVTAFCACFNLFASGRAHPVIFDIEDFDFVGWRFFISQSDGTAPLEDLSIDLLIDAENDLGQAYIAHVIERMRRYEDEEPEEERSSDAELLNEIDGLYREGDKLRISLIHCEVSSAEQEAPPETVVLGGGPEPGVTEFETSIIPLDEFQELLDQLGWSVMLGWATAQGSTAARVFQDPKTQIACKGDKRWLVQGGPLDMLLDRLDIIRGVVANRLAGDLPESVPTV